MGECRMQNAVCHPGVRENMQMQVRGRSVTNNVRAHLLVFAAFSILHSAFCISSAFAADSWMLTTGDLSSRPVALKGLDAASGASVSAPDGTNQRTVPMDQFVELER